MKRVALLVAAMLSLTGAAAAQTAEETVAYLVLGIEDGTKVDTGDGGSAVMSQTGTSPAAYAAKIVGDPKSVGIEMKVLVTQTDPCRYDISTLRSRDGQPTGDKTAGRIDFNRITSLRHDEGKLKVEGPGLCRIFGDRDCDSVNEVGGIGTTDASRVEKAYYYFRGNFCKERAF